VDDPAGASSQQREECRCGLLLTVEVPAKQVCSPVGDRCVQIIIRYIRYIKLKKNGKGFVMQHFRLTLIACDLVLHMGHF